MLASFAILGFVAAAAAQGVTERLEPGVGPPPGCRTSDPREFSISTVNATTAARRVVKRQQTQPAGPLTLQLTDGAITTNRGDTAYIAENYQFQFDNPPQTGARATAGFSVCDNTTSAGTLETLGFGDSTIFYSCISDQDSTPFSNLYNQSIGEQCSQVFIQLLSDDQAPSSSSSVSSSMAPSSTPVASSTPVVSPTTAAVTSAPVSSIADGQAQGATAAPAPVSSIVDGQPQAPTAAPTPSPVYTAGAPATGANMALAGAALLAAAML